MDKNLKQPKISVVLCTYNRANFIEQALNSVLQQSFKEFEVLIMDDCSTDNTKEKITPYLDDPRIKYISNKKNLGITKTRNLAFQFAQAKYIAVLDSDDFWTDENKLSEQFTYLEANPQVAVLGTQFIVVDQSGKEIGHVENKTSNKDIRKKFLARNQITHSSVMFRKDLAEKVGFYDENIFIWEDYDLWLRMGKNGEIENLNKYQTAYRKHGGQISREKKLKGAFTHLKIINRYKKDYPGYFPAFIKAILRIVIAFF